MDSDSEREETRGRFQKERLNSSGNGDETTRSDRDEERLVMLMEKFFKEHERKAKEGRRQELAELKECLQSELREVKKNLIERRKSIEESEN